MDFSFTTTPQLDRDALVLGVYKDMEFTDTLKDIDAKAGGAISKALKSNHFKGKIGNILEVAAPPALECNRLILVGLGERRKGKESHFQDIGGRVYASLSKTPDESVMFLLDDMEGEDINPVDAAAHLAYGCLLRSWRFDKYKTKEKDETIPSLSCVCVLVSRSDEAEERFKKLHYVADGAFLSRELVSEPPNVLNPETYAEKISELKNLGLEVEILGEKQMQKLGMNALLGVGQGSKFESQLVCIKWSGAEDSSSAPLAFVGKGVCFDTGGISLKPANGMEEMKYDMGGSATVVGLMKALAGRNAKVNAVGVVGLVENMPGGKAQRPSDIVTSMSGQTIEVLNTDAEGRLVLADALWYTQDKYKPKLMIDLATLTGAIVVALGSEYAGLFSNDDDISEQLYACGLETNEKVWRFPLHETYDKDINSDAADIQNISKTRGAGSITAAQFLKRFVNDVPWAHLDIAGTAWTKKPKPTCDKGATAFGVRLLDKFVSKYYES